MFEEELNHAVFLNKDGRKIEAREILYRIVHDDSKNIRAWMWLADTYPDNPNRILVLEECLRNNPDDPNVQKAIAALNAAEEKKKGEIKPDISPAVSQPAKPSDIPPAVSQPVKPSDIPPLVAQSKKPSDIPPPAPQSEKPSDTPTTIPQPAKNPLSRIGTYWRTGKKGKIVIIIVALVLLILICCIGMLIISSITISSPSYKATATAKTFITQTFNALPTNTSTPSKTPRPSNTPGPTNTPRPSNTPRPTNTPTAPPVGDTRDNPYPAGTSVDIGGDMTLTIIGATRPADAIVSNGNMFNSEPEAGQEYVQVDIQVICNKSSNEKCSFSTYGIKAVGADGIIHEGEIMIAGIDGLLESGDFFGGSTLAGKMFFIVPKGDKSVVIFYEPLLFGNTIYMALP